MMSEIKLSNVVDGIDQGCRSVTADLVNLFTGHSRPARVIARAKFWDKGSSALVLLDVDLDVPNVATCPCGYLEVAAVDLVNGEFVEKYYPKSTQCRLSCHCGNVVVSGVGTPAQLKAVACSIVTEWVGLESHCTEADPKNNDGRDSCYWCKGETMRVEMLTSRATICTQCGR